MRYLSPLAAVFLVLALGGCGGESVDTGSCEYLFGSPGVATGLDASACRPERVCQGSEPFIPPEYGPVAIEALRSRTLINAPPMLTADPYDDPSLVPIGIGGVCAVFADDSVPDGYRLETVQDRASAEAAGGVLTHSGACGACSSLQDLAVYLEMPDLGGPVRECSLIDLGGTPQATRDCILALGFTRPCAQIWVYNSLNTREACLVDCLEALNKPSHLNDGSLNACLACDEANSGPIFKAVAGRTRRNSGIPSAICRPGDSVEAVYHDAYP